MKNSYFLFFCLLLGCLEARKLTKVCPLIPTTTATTTPTTTPTTTQTTTPTTTQTTTPTTTPTTTQTTTTTTTPTTTTTTPTTTTTTPTTTTTTPATSSGSSSRLYGAWLLTEDIEYPMPEGWFPKVKAGNPFNTYWLSFLNPNTLFVDGETAAPGSAFTQFSLNRDAVDGPRSTDKVLYSIGGYTYSQEWLNNSWAMFDNNENAVKFAKSVASWRQLYRMDGFDLDWEYGQLTDVQAEAVYTFLVTLRALDPTIMITVEEGGYPQFSGAAAIKYATNSGQLAKLMDAVDYFNVMYYSNDLQDLSLGWVQKSWQKDCTTWCALGSIIPSKKIVLGLPGCCDQASTQASLKAQVCAKGLDGDLYAGYMIWYLPSDSTPKIAYQGVCTGSLGCGLTPNNAAANFNLPAC